MIVEVFFDVETKKLFRDISSFDPADLGVSLVSVYRRELDSSFREVHGTMRSYWEKDLSSMWEVFTSAARIIGFNSVKFDVPALKPYAPATFSKLPHFDILQIIRQALGHNLSLNTLARDTLGRGKTDDGVNAVEYLAKGDPESLEKLRSYCEADVLLTRDLYDHGLHQKFLKFTDKWNSQKIQTVDFSYPPEIISSTRQIGLF